MLSRILTILITVFIFTSCSSDDNIDLTELNANRQLWEASQIKDYKWTENLSCFCGGVLERDIFVINNIKDSVDFDESSLFEGYTREDVFNESRTIDDSFNFIEELMNSDVASLEIEYDETYGFPTLISIDYIKDAIDDEIAYSYSNFEITN